MEVYFIDVEKDFIIAFFPNSKRFFKVNQSGRDLIQDICLGKQEDTILQEYSINRDEYNNYFNLVGIDNNKCSNVCNEEIKKVKTLSRLVIHLTNDCNLQCKYCYANGGTYYSNKGKLDSATLDLIIERFYKEFDVINSVQFFGGEPLMNVPLLKEACEKIRKIDNERNYLTTFGLVTNGTIINDEIIDLIKEYNIKITISYDGDPKINDITRVDKDNKGTTDIILTNAKLLKEKTNEPNTIEVTYNQYHVDNNISVTDVVKHIQSELPNTYIHLVPAGGVKECDYAIKDLNVFAESINDIYKDLKGSVYDKNKVIPSYSLVDRIFTSLNKVNVKGSSYICDAGIGTISVSVKGDVYPCFMFTDMDSIKLGNVKDTELFRNKNFHEIRSKFLQFSNKENNAECRTCFIRNLCSGCLGLNYFNSGDPLELSTEICDMFRNMVKSVLVNHAKMLDVDEKLENSRCACV